MAYQSFTDSAGRTAYKDAAGMVYTTGGSTKTGYNVNDWNKRQLDRYGNSSSSSSKSSSNGDMQSTINNAIKMYQDANKPAISQLQSTIGQTQQSFDARASQLEAEKKPLQERYTALISQIKGNQQVAENRQTVASRNELGKRGIPLTSGVAEQEVVNSVNPVTQQYTGLIQDTGFQQEKDLRGIANDITNLGLSKTETINAIQNAIAQLQSGAATSGITQGTNIYQSSQAQNNLEQQRALAERMYQETTLPESRANVANINSTISNRGATNSDAENLQMLLNKWSGGSSTQKQSLDSFIYNG